VDAAGQGEPGQLAFLVAGHVDEADVGAVDPLERVALVAADEEHDGVDLGVDLAQVDGDLLVVTLAAAGLVVAEVHDRAVTGAQVVVERQVEQLVAGELHGRRVEVDVGRAGADGPSGAFLVPGEAHPQRRQRLLVLAGQHHLLAGGHLDHVHEQKVPAGRRKRRQAQFLGGSVAEAVLSPPLESSTGASTASWASTDPEPA
jgi:hypothetical protein